MKFNMVKNTREIFNIGTWYRSVFTNDPIKSCNYRFLLIITRRKQMHNINSEIYFFFFLTRIHSFQSTDSKNLPILSPFPFTSVPSILFHPSPPLFLYLSELENTSRINKWWSRFTRPTGYERSLTSGNGRCVSISVIEILRNIGRNSTRKVIHPESIRPIVEPMKAAL